MRDSNSLVSGHDGDAETREKRGRNRHQWTPQQRRLVMNGSNGVSPGPQPERTAEPGERKRADAVSQPQPQQTQSMRTRV
ncbi:hypothetical protein MMC07_004815, partial [Pseudocyphellaria aurata]|nr:hypothetical protein [Pseudocyphellaria aurata]